MRCKVGRQEKYRGADGHVGIERTSRQAGKGHVSRQPEEDVLMKAMVHEVNGKRKQGRPKIKWNEQVEGNLIEKDWLRKEDAADWCRKSCGRSKMHPATAIH